MAARLLAIATLALAGFATALDGQERCRAIDGDTLRCGRERVRVQGVYAPELREPGGQEAKARLQQRIDSGSLRVERHGRDKYGRTLGRVYVDGRRINQSDIGAKAGRGSRGKL
jgi:endonuclease YncB( thermonuclease family)